MPAKEIEIIIEPDGTTKAEAFNYEGKGCSDDIALVLKGLGDTKNVTKKREWKNKEVQTSRVREQ